MYGRKPDNHSVYKSKIGRRWEDVISGKKPKEPPVSPIGQSKKPYVHVWNNGILDTLFDGLEDEIERVNKKLGL